MISTTCRGLAWALGLILILFTSPDLMWAQTASGGGRQVLTPERLVGLSRLSEAHVSPSGEHVVYVVTSYDLASQQPQSRIVLQRVGGDPGAGQVLASGPGRRSQPRWHPDGRRIGFLAEHEGRTQIFEVDLSNMARPGAPRVASAYERDVELFDYLPGGRQALVVFEVALDTLPVTLYPDLPASKARIIDGLMYRHWNRWHEGKYRHPHLVAYGGTAEGLTFGREVRDLILGERHDVPMRPFGGLDDFAFSPDGQAIVYTAKKSRGTAAALSTNSDLYLYQIPTGQTFNLTASNPGYDRHPVFSPDGRYLAYTSMAKAGNEADKDRLMVLSMRQSQAAPRDLTERHEEGITGSPVFSADSCTILASVNERGTVQLYTFPVEMGPAAPRRLTQGRYNLTGAQWSRQGWVATRTSMQAPPDLVTVSTGNGSLRPITQVNQTALNGIQLATVRERRVRTSDGQQMHFWVILPPGFDTTRRYPVLLYCQGGPQSPVSQNFSFRWNFMALASRGYVIVAPNRRGLPGFGRKWNDDISGDWGGQPMRDYLAAIDDVAREPWADETRMGAIGASYGGYSVYYLAGIHKKRFKTFASHCGVFNLESMYGTTEEMFFANHELGGPYWSPRAGEAYREHSPHRRVQEWDTPMLVIHGGLDFRVPESQGMEAFQAAQIQGIPSRMVYFPDEGHWVQKPQNSVLWHRELFRWLDTYLKPSAP